MADTKISALAANSPAELTNEFPVNDSGTTKRVSLTDVQTLFAGTFPRYKVCAADQTAVVGTAYADAAASLDTATSGTTPMRFQYMIAWAPNATTTGGRFAVTHGAITRLVYSVRWNTTATVITQSPLGTAVDQAFTVGTASDATNNLAIIEGIIVPSGAGTLKLRASAEVVSPGSVTVKAGSSLLYW